MNDLGSQSSVLALDESVIDVDQVDNLIKFCPTKEEAELLKVFFIYFCFLISSSDSLFCEYTDATKYPVCFP